MRWAVPIVCSAFVGCATSGGTTDMEAASLAQQAAGLQERIAQSRSRLRDVAGPRVVLVHRNELGGDYFLKTVAYALDGELVFATAGPEAARQGDDRTVVFDGRIRPEEHRLVVEANLEGGSPLISDYKFHVNGNYRFVAKPGKVTTLGVVFFEAGGPLSDAKDRPKVRYEITTADDPEAPLTPDGGQAPAAP